MGNRLVRGFTFVANKGMKLDANISKAKLFLAPAIWANRVGLRPRESLHFIFCAAWHLDFQLILTKSSTSTRVERSD